MIKMFDAAFTTQETFYQHPELRQGAVLRPQALSALSTKTRRMYSPAIARAFTYLATGELTILQSPDAAIKVSYMTSDHRVIECHSLPLKSDPARRLWLFNQEHPSAHAVLALTEAVLTPHWPQALQAVKVLAQESGYPITTDALHALPGSNDDFVTALMRFVDTLYYEGKGQEGQIAVQAEVTDPAPYAARATTNDGVRPERITRVIGLDGGQPRSASGGRSHVDRLIRLTERGGVAMLVGPPATFKTETVKHVVQRTGAQVVKMRGAPGVEDRDFIGTVMPGETGARWQDGPLAVAFGLAYFGRTVSCLRLPL